MANLDYLRKKAKITNPHDEAIADKFFNTKGAPGVYQMVPTDQIDPDPRNPRTSMDPDRLQQLSDSIREKGIIHPLNLIELESGRYRVEEGHRRLAAALKAGVRSVPAIIKANQDLSEEDVRERQLVENLHNEALPPIDAARAIRRLMDDHSLSVRHVARKISLPRSTVDEYLAILRIPEELLSMPGAARLPKKALVLVSREPTEQMPERMNLALRSENPWQTVQRARRPEDQPGRHRQRFALKSGAGSITVSLEKRGADLTNYELGQAYLEASEVLRKQGKELLAS